jgi:hypothetical protein
MNAQIMQACGITQADINSAKANAAAETTKLRASNNCTNDFWGCDVSASDETYGISGTRVPIRNSGKALGYIAADLVVTLSIFEILRRAFYYVATGSVKPSK